MTHKIERIGSNPMTLSSGKTNVTLVFTKDLDALEAQPKYVFLLISEAGCYDGGASVCGVFSSMEKARATYEGFDRMIADIVGAQAHQVSNYFERHDVDDVENVPTYFDLEGKQISYDHQTGWQHV